MIFVLTIMNADSEQMRVVYEGAVKLNPSDVEAVQYLAVWHLERYYDVQIFYY